MRVIVNQTEYEVPQDSLICNLLDYVQAKPPFAVAVNLTFVPKTQYALQVLNENDKIEIISPVTGG